MTAVRGTTVDIATQDGTADAYLVHPDDDAAHPAVLFYMDAFGLRPHLRAMADRLAGAGYTVLVPNVFHRSGRTPVFDLPEFIDPAARPEIWDQILPVMLTLTPELALRDAAAYLEWLADSPRAAAGPVGITGYCMGARLALHTAGAFPERVAAAAGFHGGRLATDAPDSPHLAVARITGEVYFGHADEDPSLPAEQIDLLDKTLTEAGVRHRTEVYAGASHGYTQADTAAYDAGATARHWTALLDLLDRNLSRPRS
ncbi:dienelactone hydrolase family protein [Streptomyces europaeiscabiei]|uniref:Dienelactone hydrolase family protein n=5 Tax=Streptomyces europaeiscabiei TaxID=146819 RepID=A0ABU4NTM4_9ACTN|nr:dienelactone hydrolase family protein [Streptomyces europaeiscabiei]MDX2524930.1 dienelactone hydrolase family protein [Streptomyces europaeiscabiei]MDX2773934.1 dienelactone hydrolase family protein [Streptomyces europaeiscabiei]MDX3547811.1 dienelactone hydrolase family protein [Streptomyces europaeiscabiei]MDX3557681.1 dienelactone hydrolase family protein [Streptomyces europaeiscabiei]MDX3668546.1 dienelactone hydrolase family protein [Streptomyces europaeiscabiei]